MTICIAGAGRVAQALGRQLRERGQPVRAVASRSREHACAAAAFIGGDVEAVTFEGMACDRVVIAVPDAAIVDVALRLPASVKMVLHTCGAHGAELLDPLRERGVRCGSIHPLQTFASPEAGYEALPGIAFAVDGDAEALAWAEKIVRVLDGSILRISSDSRALYHAAAAMASNHLIAVIDASVQTMREAGVAEETALLALAPLMRRSLENAVERGPLRALTGPVERGDVHTVEVHLRALTRVAPSVHNLYRAASLQALAMVRRRGKEALA